MRKRVFKPGNETAVAVRVETIDIRISFDDFSRIDAQPSETYSPVFASLGLRITRSTRTVGSSFEVENGDVRYPRLAFIVLNERSLVPVGAQGRAGRRIRWQPVRNLHGPRSAQTNSWAETEPPVRSPGCPVIDIP